MAEEAQVEMDEVLFLMFRPCASSGMHEIGSTVPGDEYVFLYHSRSAPANTYRSDQIGAAAHQRNEQCHDSIGRKDLNPLDAIP
jgi:hypothetical protein